MKEDEEIIGFISERDVGLVAVDAPLSLPRKGGNQAYRECDRRLVEMGVRLLPLTLPPMRMLTLRGMRLKRRLERLGYRVVEVYPGGAQDILGIPRKRKGLEELRRGLESLGLKGLRSDASADELDAATCALVGWMYLQGRCMEVGDPEEGIIIIPKKFK